MLQFLDFAKNYKTYAIVAVGIGSGLYAHFTGHDLPQYVDWIFMLAGLGTTRSAISRQSKVAADDVAVLVQQVLSNLTVPEAQGTNLPANVPPKPTPPGSDEKAITDSLNAAQVKK